MKHLQVDHLRQLHALEFCTGMRLAWLATLVVILIALLEVPAAAFVNVADFGATGDGSDATTAIQNAIDYANSNGDMVYIPAGDYAISATLVVGYKNGLRIVGDGERASNLRPTANLAGKPVIQILDGAHDTLEDLSVWGVPGNPPSAGVESDSASGGESTHLTMRNVAIGSDSAASLVDGVKFAMLDANADYNNDMGFFSNVSIRNFTHAGYSILHSNSLVHTIIGGIIANGPIGVYTQAGSFKMVGTHFENLSDVAFDLENPSVAAQAYQHPLVIANISVDGAAGLLRTASTSLMVTMAGVDGDFGNKTASIFDFHSSYGMLFVGSSYFYRTGPGSIANFVGGANQVVDLSNSQFNVASVSVDGRLFSQANCWKGSPALSVTAQSTVTESNEVCGTLNVSRHKTR